MMLTSNLTSTVKLNNLKSPSAMLRKVEDQSLPVQSTIKLVNVRI